MERIFLLYHPGHSGGSWFHACCRVHPQKITILEEAHLAQQLDFEYETMDDFDDKVIAYLEWRLYCGDACVGTMKSFGHKAAAWGKERGAVVAQIYRNPIKILARNLPRGHKLPWIRRNVGKPTTNQEVFEGHVIYYARMFEAFLKRAEQGAIMIRLEKLTASVRTDGRHFIQIMEAITQLPWTDRQVEIIRAHRPPGVAYNTHVEQYPDGSYGRPYHVPYVLEPDRLDWEPDQSAKLAWRSWKPWQRRLWLEHMSEIMPALGYDNWEIKG